MELYPGLMAEVTKPASTFNLHCKTRYSDTDLIFQCLAAEFARAKPLAEAYSMMQLLSFEETDFLATILTAPL